ncbi:hypothetical protein CVUC_02310 [Caulobacter vibrioides]|nr:hypothetical protein CA608_20145 [Caulobacter vibrioides]PLR15947.1 hypothetical protein CVUC_02310 [Caulobacter vibrioides]
MRTTVGSGSHKILILSLSKPHPELVEGRGFPSAYAAAHDANSARQRKREPLSRLPFAFRMMSERISPRPSRLRPARLRRPRSCAGRGGGGAS